MASATIRRMVLIVGCLAATAGQTVAVLQRGSGQGLDNETDPFAYVWSPEIPGTKPLAKSLDLPGELDRRACLANGTNYCFTDQAKFCAGCGICCGGSSDYCCAADQQCCGSACCAAGQTCRDGHCFLPLETYTVTRTNSVTGAVHVATQVATVLEIVEETSTILSIVEVTVSSADTETDVIYVTKTAHAKRAAISGARHKRLGRYKAPRTRVLGRLASPSGSFASPARRGAQLLEDVVASKIAAATAATKGVAATTTTTTTTDVAAPTESAAAPIASTAMVTVLVTQSDEITRIESTTVTAPTTSLVLTTIFRTDTKVLNAQQTVLVTSTIAVTSHKPTTRSSTKIPTVASTATESTATPTPSAGPPIPAHTTTRKLTPSIIVAIVVAGLFGIGIIITLAIIYYRRSRVNREFRKEAKYYLESGFKKDGRKPTLPSIYSPQNVHHARPGPQSVTSGTAYSTASPTSDTAYRVPPPSPSSPSMERRLVNSPAGSLPSGQSGSGPSSPTSPVCLDSSELQTHNASGVMSANPPRNEELVELPNNEVKRPTGDHALPVPTEVPRELRAPQRTKAGRARQQGYNAALRAISGGRLGPPLLRRQDTVSADAGRPRESLRQQYKDTEAKGASKSPLRQSASLSGTGPSRPRGDQGPKKVDAGGPTILPGQLLRANSKLEGPGRSMSLQMQLQQECHHFRPKGGSEENDVGEDEKGASVAEKRERQGAGRTF